MSFKLYNVNPRGRDTNDCREEFKSLMETINEMQKSLKELTE